MEITRAVQQIHGEAFWMEKEIAVIQFDRYQKAAHFDRIDSEESEHLQSICLKSFELTGRTESFSSPTYEV